MLCPDYKHMKVASMENAIKSQNKEKTNKRSRTEQPLRKHFK